jgi:hypothetical protein
VRDVVRRRAHQVSHAHRRRGTRVVLLVVAAAAMAATAIALWRAAPRATAGTPPAEQRRDEDIARWVNVPTVRGRPETCLLCHAGITGLDASHRPEAIGCAACHLGDPASRDARTAHTGMVRIPGNLADSPRTCGQVACHASIVPRMERSIMATMAGVIAVDRRVFGESDSAGSPPHVAALGASAADTHLRQLCASCHLGQLKTEWAPIDELSRGGGCNACHLSYDSTAAAQLAAYQSTAPRYRTSIPRRHPALTIAVGNGACFGCHSRSGRLSTNFEGWMELATAPAERTLDNDAQRAIPQYRRLSDGRYFTRVTPDVHQARGMACIDCHVPGEVMGTGKVVAHARDQVQIRCEDCHAARLPSIRSAHGDAETATLLALRGWKFGARARLVVAASGPVLSNVLIDPDSGVRLRHKLSGGWAPVRAPRAVCTQGGGHARLSCSACHSAWAPRCATCHTKFDAAGDGFDHAAQQEVRGSWVESSGPYEAVPPTLGIRAQARDDEHPNGVVETFIPGMILDLDRARAPGQAPDRITRRLYARTAPHTTVRSPRSCTSCHNDPVALGFGRGTLRYEHVAGVGRWRFTPEQAIAADGLPADAWTGFLQTRRGVVSTRDDVRPFSAQEQRRILTAGACLTCHDGASAVMQRAIADFDATLARRTKRCVVPAWDR